MPPNEWNWAPEERNAARLDAGASQERTDQLNLVEQLPARHAHKAISVNFAKDDAAIGAL